MTRQVVSYVLNADGTIPAYILDGGYYPNYDVVLENTILLGVADTTIDTAEVIAIYETQKELEAYIGTYLENKQYSNDTSVSPFSVSEAAQTLINKTLTE